MEENVSKMKVIITKYQTRMVGIKYKNKYKTDIWNFFTLSYSVVFVVFFLSIRGAILSFFFTQIVML